MDLRPAKYDIQVWRNDTLSLNFALSVDNVPIDLTNATIRMQVRPTFGSNTLSLALTEGNGITVSGTNNNVIELRKNIAIEAGDYVYDIEAAFDNGYVKTYVQGVFQVSEDSTK